LPDEFHAGLTLDRIFENSYLTLVANLANDAPPPSPDYLAAARRLKRSYYFPRPDPERRKQFLDHCAINSYYVWLEKGIQKVHQFNEKITPENWDRLSERICERHNSPLVHLDILRDVGKYRRSILDNYWNYGSNNGHPEIFASTIRTDMFVTSFHPSAPDHDGNTPFQFYRDAPIENFDDYLKFLEDLFTKWRENGAVAMKSASAYDRSLDYGEADRAEAARIFYQPIEKVSAAGRKYYEDFMFNWFCQLAIRLDVPFQVHTGLGKLSGSSPLKFEPVILRYPQIHFVLFHAGYPWYDDLAGLAHNYSNISIDMVWTPIISTTGAILALHEFLEVAHSSDRIAWGSDAWTSEEAIGALLAWRHVIAKVLAEKVDDGYLDMAEAEHLAEKLMYRNAAKLYGFKVG